ncbi:MAG: hypothetical protein EZS28_038032, partial [Streblomastix strix]
FGKLFIFRGAQDESIINNQRFSVEIQRQLLIIGSVRQHESSSAGKHGRTQHAEHRDRGIESGGQHRICKQQGRICASIIKLVAHPKAHGTWKRLSCSRKIIRCLLH